MKNFYMIATMATAILTISTNATTSFSQDRNQSWQFKGQNRASIAALIRDVEENGRGSGTAMITPAGSYTNLVCGKDGQTSAAGNTTCIILNNSDGKIDVGQDSNGNQTATTNTETQQSDADAVLDALTNKN